MDQLLEQKLDEYEKYIAAKKGPDAKAIEAYVAAAKHAYNHCKRSETLQVCARAKEIIDQFVFTQTKGGDIWWLEKQAYEKKERYTVVDHYYSILLIEARLRIVDSGFRYLEKKRIPRERFYMNRRKQLIKFGLIDALQGMIDDKYDIVCVSLVPGAGKTTIEKFFHALVIGWFPNDYSLFYSHSGDITRMYYDGVYQIVSDTSEYAWHDIFPDLQITSTNAKLEQFNVGKYKPFPSLQCTSVGSNNAGKVRASKFLLVDDMIGGIEQALNKRILDGLWNKYTVDARQRKVEDFEGKPCKELHLATRWSVHDVIGRIMREYGDNPRVKIISVPDVDPETGESNFDYERGGFTKEFFADQQRLMDEISYRCLYKQEPVEREGLLYHEDELMRYLMLPEREPDAIIGVCDTKAKGTDFMALPCCYQYGDEFYLVDCVYDDNADFGVQEEKVASLILRYNLQQCQFESNVGGDRFAANVAKRVADAHGRCNITTKPTETNKETKIIVNADWVKKHIYFPDKSLIEPKSDMEKFIADLLTYTVSGKNAHDDAPDSMAMFALYITNGNRVATVEAISNPFRVNHAALNFYWGNDGY